MQARWWLHQTAGQTTTRVPSSQTTKQLCDYFVLFYFFSSLFLPFLAFADFIVVVSKINFNGTTYFLGFFFFFFWNVWHTVATIAYLRPFSNTEYYHRICLSKSWSSGQRDNDPESKFFFPFLGRKIIDVGRLSSSGNLTGYSICKNKNKLTVFNCLHTYVRIRIDNFSLEEWSVEIVLF